MPFHPRRRKRLAALLISLLASLGLSACDRGDSKTAGQHLDAAVADSREALDKAGKSIDHAAERGGEAASEAYDKTRAAATDLRITAEVKTALARAPEVAAHEIKVDTDNGRVKLEGEVDSIAIRTKAEQLAAATPGVRSVDSQLVVRQGKPS
ncbi:BON domain-containing protein [Derxia lacustris]|uniref:BON domain-containing protein n=1 Tax=Derxia lacustris TaxID=764842 RepID=UPI000A16DD80|nr:BON domain-containing protein [Derxia lacustris]